MVCGGGLRTLGGVLRVELLHLAGASGGCLEAPQTTSPYSSISTAGILFEICRENMTRFCTLREDSSLTSFLLVY